MFYRQCNNCNQRWELGVSSTCTCPDETPKRTWVGLTDEEIQYCVELKNPEAIAEEVEAKLKEQNNG